MAFNDLKITVTKVEGDCSNTKVGSNFFVKNGCLQIPEGKSLCLFALGSLLPVLTAAIIKSEKGEGILDNPQGIVNEWQCPNAAAKVLFTIEAMDN
jgi:uncharacterized repeat protein (TIGR04076 family)